MISNRYELCLSSTSTEDDIESKIIQIQRKLAANRINVQVPSMFIPEHCSFAVATFTVPTYVYMNITRDRLLYFKSSHYDGTYEYEYIQVGVLIECPYMYVSTREIILQLGLFYAPRCTVRIQIYIHIHIIYR